jgi:pilus assembly protein Flp/PilA
MLRARFRFAVNKQSAASRNPPHSSEQGVIQMKTLAQRVRRFLASEDGPTAVEYAVMLVLIVTVCLVAVTSVGSQTSTTFSNMAASLGGAS